MKSAWVRRNRSRYSPLLLCFASSNWVNRATCSVLSGSAFCWGSSASPSCVSCCITSILFQNLTATAIDGVYPRSDPQTLYGPFPIGVSLPQHGVEPLALPEPLVGVSLHACESG